MAEERLSGPELKKHIKIAKKQAMPFAYAPGKKEDPVLMMHRRKNASVLGKLAKKEGEGQKVAFGTAEVQGKLMTLTCEKAVPQMAKQMKKFLRKNKISINIVVIGPDGAELESDIEDLPYDPEMDDDDDIQDDANDTEEQAAAPAPEGEEAAAPPPPPPPPPGQAEAAPEAPEAADTSNAEALMARLRACAGPIKTAPDGKQDTLTRLFQISAGLIKSDDLVKADQTITKLEEVIAQLPPPKPKDPKEEAKKKQTAKEIEWLKARAKNVQGAIADLPEPALGKMTNALRGVIKAIKAEKLKEAAKALDTIEAALKKLGKELPDVPAPAAGAQAAAEEAAQAVETAATSPEETKWLATFAALQPRIDLLIQEKRGDLAAINRVMGFAQDQAAAGAFGKALAASKKLEELLAAGEAMETTAAAAEAAEAAPDNVVLFTQKRLGWVRTRQDLNAQIASLKDAIEKQTAGMEGLEDVPAKTGVLFDYLKDIDSKLEDTLEAMVETPDGEKRESLKKQARGIIGDYRGVLDSGFFQAVDNNGFANTNIRATALASLKDVSSALEA